MNPQDLVRALAVALATLHGNAGGYSPTEKDKAIKVLDELFQDTMKQLSTHVCGG